MRMQSTNQWRN